MRKNEEKEKKSDAEERKVLTSPPLLLLSESRDPARFIALFREVWARMPESIRQDLARGWGDRGRRRPAHVELCDLGELGSDVSTDVDDGGRTLRFDATLFDGAAPTLVRGGIAFVLACAWICSHERTVRMNELLNYIAFSLAGEWGFALSTRDKRAIERWLQSRKVGPSPSMTKPETRRRARYVPAYVATSWDAEGGELAFEPVSAVVSRGDRQLAREIVRRAGNHGVAYQRSVRRALAPLFGDGR